MAHWLTSLACHSPVYSIACRLPSTFKCKSLSHKYVKWIVKNVLISPFSLSVDGQLYYMSHKMAVAYSAVRSQNHCIQTAFCSVSQPWHVVTSVPDISCLLAQHLSSPFWLPLYRRLSLNNHQMTLRRHSLSYLSLWEGSFTMQGRLRQLGGTQLCEKKNNKKKTTQSTRLPLVRLQVLYVQEIWLECNNTTRL